jgi:hypothetical protein
LEPPENKGEIVMKKKFLPVIAALLAVMIIVPAGCAGIDPLSTAPSGQSTGRLEVRVTDAPPDKKVTAVNVTVASVEIHKADNATTTPTTTPTATTAATATVTATTTAASDSGWMPLQLKAGAGTFDLLQIQGLEQLLADGNLTPGKYTQIRMEVTKVVVTFTENGQSEDVEATLPSGKLKFVHPFEIAAGQTTVLLFDFDALKSINTTGNGKVMFKPVIKLTMTKTPGNMEIITPALPNGLIDFAYPGVTLAATGGTATYTWSLKAGSVLPAGMTLAATGLISGTPTAAGNFPITIRVEDSSTVKKAAEKAFTLNIGAAGTVQIATTSLPDGVIGVPYNAMVVALGGTGTWSIFPGTLPLGLVLDVATGLISGTPLAPAGDSTFTMTFTATTLTDSQVLTIHIAAAVTP